MSSHGVGGGTVVHKATRFLFAAIVAMVAAFGSIASSAQGVDSPGIYVSASGAWFLRYSNSGGSADGVFTFGPGGGGLVPLKGDWDGSGEDTPGLYVPSSGVFFLRNANSAGAADLAFTFGAGGGGLVPLVGDWNGDGVDTIGLYVPATGAFFLRNTNSSGAADIVFTFGPGGGGFVPIVGDWDGDGVDTIGLYNPATGVFFLRNSNSSGPADLAFSFGPPGATPLAGDWNGDGADTIGIYSAATGVFFLRNSNSSGTADLAFSYGPPNVVPLMGRWNANGGSLVNGALHTGAIATRREVDVWTFTAIAGDRIAVHIGEIVDNNDFRPWIRLEAPDGSILGRYVGHSMRPSSTMSSPRSPAPISCCVASFDSGPRRHRHLSADDDAHAGADHGVAGRPGRAADQRRDSHGRDRAGRSWTCGRSRPPPASGSPCTSARSPTPTTSGRGCGCGRRTAPPSASTSGLAAAVIDDVVAPVTGTYLVLVASFDTRRRRHGHLSADDDAHAGPDHGVARRPGRAADQRRDAHGRDRAGRSWTCGRSRPPPASGSPCTSARSPRPTTSGRGCGCGRPTAPPSASTSGLDAAVDRRCRRAGDGHLSGARRQLRQRRRRHRAPIG